MTAGGSTTHRSPASSIEIGAAPVVVLTIAGQQLASVAVDRFGLLRLPQRAITRHRLVGAAILLAGVALITVR